MEKINKKYIRNKIKQDILNKISKLNSYLTSILKLSLVLTLFFIAAFLISGAGVIVEDGALNVSNDLLVNTNTLYVDSVNNRVGIGTLDPADTLHLNSSDNTRIRLEGTQPIMRFERTYGTPSFWQMYVQDTTDTWLFQYGVVGTYLAIDNTGNVGVGDTTPSEALDVNGNVRADELIEYSEVFTGNALTILNNIKARDAEGEWKPLNHSSLPTEIIKEYTEEGTCAELNLPESAECVDLGNNESKVYGRSLNDMVAINTRALQQLIDEIETLKNELCKKDTYSWC